MILKTLALATGLSLAAASATAGGDTSQPGADLPFEGQRTTASWSVVPSGEQMANYYPKLAGQTSLPGLVKMHCAVSDTGALSGCAIQSETPVGMGFGAAALSLSSYFVMKPATENGRAVASDVIIPIRFQPPNDSSPTDESAAQASATPKALELARRIEAATEGPARITPMLDTLRQGWMGRFDGQSMTEQQQAMIDDYVAAVGETELQVAETDARRLAARLTEQQLSDVDAFVESPAGQAWLTHPPADDSARAADMTRLTAASNDKARALFCAKYACVPPRQGQ
jgi:hypothetical protein